MYGLSGASGKLHATITDFLENSNPSSIIIIVHVYVGRHNCLWCTIRSTDLKAPLHVRGHSSPRSLESIREDNQRFVNAGNNLKRAKEFNNAIAEPFFSIPLDQVRLF